jgi:thiamine transport system ATP-binding protein
VSGGLNATGLRISHDGVPVLNGLDLSVAPGEVLAVLGPSGSGKSSLLAGLAGLLPLAAGSVSFDGTDVTHVPVHRRGFGLVFQDPLLFPHLDVGANVAFGLHGLDRRQRQHRTRELLDLVGLPAFADRRVSTLSGGEAQRIALARALAPEPRVLLLDEPFAALDRPLRLRLAADVAALLRRLGTPAVLVTHDEAEADAVADRIMRLGAGPGDESA